MSSFKGRVWAGSVVGLALFLGAAVLLAPHIPVLVDFDQTFYPASRYLLAGQNPYTSPYVVVDAQNNAAAFFSPAWLLVILAPFGLLPLPVGRAAWLLFLLGVTLFGLHKMRQVWQIRSVWVLLLAVVPWSLISLLYGQVTPLMFAGTFYALSAIEQEEWQTKDALWLVVSFLLIGLKPQLGGLIALPLLWVLWQRRDPRLWWLVGGGVIAMAMTVIGMWSFVLNGLPALPAPHWTATLERELWLWQWPSGWAQVVRVGILVTMGVWAWRLPALMPAWWSAWLTTILIVAPYVRAYDDVLLLPILAQLYLRSKWALLLFMGLVGLYMQWHNAELGSVVIPLLAWLIFVPMQMRDVL